MNVLHIYKTCILQSQGGVETFINTLWKFDSLLGVENKILNLHNLSYVEEKALKRRRNFQHLLICLTIKF